MTSPSYEGAVTAEQISRFNYQHRDIIEDGGGIYVPGMMADLVMFNSPETGSTLCLPENKLTADAVRTKIAYSNAAFGIKTEGTRERRESHRSGGV